MKKIFATTFNSKESWEGNKNKFHKLFTWLTGYYIMFEESRKDLVTEKMERN